MAISKKPIKQPHISSEDTIKAIIGKGGTVPSNENQADEPNNESDIKRLQLRISNEVVNMIDQIRNSNLIKPSRHQWILEAIMDRINKENIK